MGSVVTWTEMTNAGQHAACGRFSAGHLVCLTFPGLRLQQRAPVAPLAVTGDVVVGSDLDLVNVSRQSVEDHHRTLRGVDLRGQKSKYEGSPMPLFSAMKT